MTSRNMPNYSVAHLFANILELFLMLLLKSAIHLTRVLRLDMFNFIAAITKRNFKILDAI